jgi:hypothetical protein
MSDDKLSEWDRIITAAKELIAATEKERAMYLEDQEVRELLEEPEIIHYFLRSEFPNDNQDLLQKVFYTIDVQVSGYIKRSRYDKDYEDTFKGTCKILHNKEKDRKIVLDESNESFVFDEKEAISTADMILEQSTNFQDDDIEEVGKPELEYGDWDDPAYRIIEVLINLKVLIPFSQSG